MYQGPGIYRHYKGAQYEALGVALEEATKIPVVIYRPLGEWPEDVPPADFWSRPLADFNSTVSFKRPRFQLIA